MAKTRILAVILAFSCMYAAAQPTPVVLRGTIVTPDKVINDGFVAISGEKIMDVGPFTNAPAGISVIDSNSVIFPGLIDLHNHITWNVFPRWRQNVEFSTRYEWQQRVAYGIALGTPHAKIFQEGAACYTNRFGEIKAIVGGATSVAGTLAPSPSKPNDNKCIVGMARNLDFYSGFYGSEVNQEKLRYEVFPMQVSLNQVNQIISDLASGKLTSYIAHLAEGSPTSPNAMREFNMFQSQGMLQKGVSIIHGVALGRSQFKLMASHGVGLIWSPRSNIELYGSTTDVATAKQEGVTIAIAPDWSPSGSDGMIQELKYVATWNEGQNPAVFSDAELVAMATSIPAKLARLDDKIGSIRKGLYADLLLIKKSDVNPLQALLRANPADVRLVIINGVSVYGDNDLMNKFPPRHLLQPLNLCGVDKSLYIEPAPDVPDSWKEMTEYLKGKLNRWGSDLAPLTTCSGTNL
jgi:hypothetical protein